MFKSKEGDDGKRVPLDEVAFDWGSMGWGDDEARVPPRSLLSLAIDWDEDTFTFGVLRALGFSAELRVWSENVAQLHREETPGEGGELAGSWGTACWEATVNVSGFRLK